MVSNKTIWKLTEQKANKLVDLQIQGKNIEPYIRRRLRSNHRIRKNYERERNHTLYLIGGEVTSVCGFTGSKLYDCIDNYNKYKWNQFLINHKDEVEACFK